MPDDPRPHETRDIHTGNLALAALAMLLFIAAMLWILYTAYGGRGERWPPPGRAAQDNAVSPAFRTEPETELAAVTAEQQARLAESGPLPEEPGFARIPIEDVMNLIAEHGLPDWSAEGPGGECALLAQAVPRSPQAAECRREDPP
ncbi:hypothetical protein Rumeso_04533 [Rubellimicrobium mesophilum DSM 19309]|uniref:Uncharacterized protein n=1 Tax=Rubellimicrobium mesophilum DSM 19309 TaxID=442562 RepID=A0A017HHV6_9RHOB|nr:hypothetical protein [Rubellimicrobium mesophilum]EYD73936.1 hypothetical protein Rumeso_04533 [Rubellimicrobium mesophilum DSM 19309]